MYANEKVYQLSNQMATVDCNCLSKKEFFDLLRDKNRQKDSQTLVDYLCKKFNIDKCVVKVVNKSQPHSTGYNGNLKNKTMGVYEVGKDEIIMYNLTAINKKEVAIKTFADTLLHEFIHHYDIKYLKLPTSIHTSGFYKRIADLKEKLS